MQKLSQKIAKLPQDGAYISLEFFPPKTQMGLSNLQSRLQRMADALRPLFVTVTWGAGGSTAARSLELAEICQRQLGITTCLHLTCTNMSTTILDETLEEAKAIGICNILALRGDPPREEYAPDCGSGDNKGIHEFVWAADLVRYIRTKHGDFFCVGVAAYPEGHADESHPTSQDVEQDLPFLIEKVNAGADFIMTQLFYDGHTYLRFEAMLRQHESGVFKHLPIIPGLMPIQSYQTVKRTAKLSHASLPQDLLARLDVAKGDDEAIKEVGVDALTAIIKSIRCVGTTMPRGFHFYTLNLEKVVGWILEKSDLLPRPDELSTRSPLPGPLLGGHLASPISRVDTLAVTHGLTQAGREATWDDYPNGRFGDARSPAFNLPMSYSPYAFDVSPQQARKLWGQPVVCSMVTVLFADHLTGRIPSQLPWSDTATLSSETRMISDDLLTLIKERAWWTIASQPAVDGLPSTDSVHGWGPTGGYVFQKPFVEFFLPEKDWHERLRPSLIRANAESEVSWYAENCHREFESSESQESVHALTWGSFVGKEISTATMVDQVNFRQWAEEAFLRWEQWSRVVLEKESRDFLQTQKQSLWLVNVIGHGYRQNEGRRLWEILMST